jgi:hypothetical protein
MSFPDFNQAFSVRALHRAMQRAMKGHRGDPEAAAFLLEAGPRLCDLSARLLAESWRPSPYRTFPIRDPKPRMVAVVDFADRVVHHALVAGVEPAIDPQLDPDSFACRKGKGLHRCVDRAQELLRAYPYCLSLDIEGYFRELPHGSVLATLRGFGTSELFVHLFARVLAAHEAPSLCKDGDSHEVPLAVSPLTPHPSPLSRGMCIGALTSQFLGNLGLHPVEAMLRREFPDTGHARYMDDILVLGSSTARLWEVHAAVSGAVNALGLTLKSEATLLAPTTEGISYCGYRIFRSVVRLRPRSLTRLGRRIAATERKHLAGPIDRVRAESSVTTRINHAATADTLEWRKELVRRLWP